MTTVFVPSQGSKIGEVDSGSARLLCSKHSVRCKLDLVWLASLM